MEPSKPGDAEIPQLANILISLAFFFFYSLPFIPFCSCYFLSRSMELSKAWKKGFVGMESIQTECSILSNQGGLGALEPLQSRSKSCPSPLLLPQAPTELSWDPAEVQLIHQHVFLSLKNKSTKQERALESLYKNYLKKQVLLFQYVLLKLSTCLHI